MKKAITCLLIALFLCSCSITFDQEIWLKEPDKRGAMVSSMLNQYKLEGMGEVEVVELLGQPSDEGDEPERYYLYYLGRAGLGVDDLFLKLYFNADGELERYVTTSD